VTLGQWLNKLTNVDFFVILALFLMGCLLSYFTISGFKSWYGAVQKQNKYMLKIRITPFALLIPAIFYTIILYRIFGTIISDWVK